MARKKRSLAPRALESVNRQLDSQSDDSGPSRNPYDLTLNPNLKDVRLVYPAVYMKGGLTTFRIWNMLDPEDPGESLLNGRLNEHELAGLGGMSISEPAYCVRYAGINYDSGLLADKKEARPVSYVICRDRNQLIEGVEFWDLPYVKLRTVCNQAVKASTNGNISQSWNLKWNALIAGRDACVTPFKQKYFVVSSLYNNGSKLDLIRESGKKMANGTLQDVEIPRNGVALGDAPDDPLIVLELSISAGRNMLKMCTREQGEWDSEAWDAKNQIPKAVLKSGQEAIDKWVSETEEAKERAEEQHHKRYKRDMGFKYGDPCGRYNPKTGTVKGGVFFSVYNPEKVDIESPHTSYSGTPSSSFAEYQCLVHAQYDGPNGKITADMSAEQVDNVFNKHVYLWKASEQDADDSYLLHVPGIEERCVKIAQAFKQLPKLLEFGWMSKPEYLNYEEVQAVVKARKSVAVQLPEADEDEEEDTIPFPTDPEPAVAAKAKTASELADDFDDDFDDDELDEDELDDDLDDDDDDLDDDDDDLDDDDDDAALIDQDDDDDDDDDDEDDDEDEEDLTESEDFDEFDDEVSDDVEAALEASLAAAKGLSRSKARVKKPTKKKATKKKDTEKKATKKRTKKS